jgi:hypothetical protein
MGPRRRRSIGLVAATVALASCSLVTSFDGVGVQPASDAADDGSSGDGTLSEGGPCQGLQCQQVQCADGATTTLSGTVRDPAMLNPVYDAIVYIPNGPVVPFTQGISCDRCGAVPSGDPIAVALTGADGTFSLNDVPVGSNIPLVIQIGKWRRQVAIPTVTACTNNVISDGNLTRLPKDKTEGDIPHIAITTGVTDAVECLLRKMGIADTEFTDSTAAGRIHLYQASIAMLGGGATAGPATKPATTLWSSAALLAGYDMVIDACEGDLDPQPAASLQNMADYASNGGRMLGTHEQYVWVSAGPAPLPSAATIDAGTVLMDPAHVTVETGFPKGAAFADWLVAVGVSATRGTVPLTAVRTDVTAVNAATTTWLGVGTTSITYFSFNAPFGAAAGTACGKMAIADLHVLDQEAFPAVFPTECATALMSANEQAVEFLLFELSSCVQDDTLAPKPPPTK